jgi:integrase
MVAEGKPARTRRDNGLGSAYYDATRGKWRGEVMVGFRPDGGRDIRKVSAETKGAVLKLLADLRKRHEAGALGTVEQERRTLSEYLARWLGAKRATVRATTLDRYGDLLRLHVVPVLGRVALKDVKPDQVQALYAQKLAEGLSPRTVHHLHRCLSNALSDAVKWGEAPRNVCALVDPPAVPYRELTPPTGEEVGALLAAAEEADDRLRGLWALAAMTGMRLGELTGLRWSDVDLESGVLHVRRGLVGVVARVPTFSQPKTGRSRRRVPLSAESVAVLKAHRVRQLAERVRLGEAWGLGLPGNADLVFTTHFGTALDKTVGQHFFKLALARASLRPSLRFHDLRHFAATQMLADGVDVATVSAILGHANAAITLTVYAHAIPHRLQTGVDAIARAIRLPVAGFAAGFAGPAASAPKAKTGA